MKHTMLKHLIDLVFKLGPRLQFWLKILSLQLFLEISGHDFLIFSLLQNIVLLNLLALKLLDCIL